MAEEEEMIDNEEEVEEEAPPPPGIDYEEVDPETGFKKVERAIWDAYKAAVLDKPEDERDDADEWAENYATENKVTGSRVNTVLKLGIYAGPRDEYNQRSGEGKAIYSNGDTYEGQYWEGKKNGKGIYTFKSVPISEVNKLISQNENSGSEAQDEYVDRIAEKLKIGREIVNAAIAYGPYPCYRGDYVNNLRHGKGVMKNKDGSVYKGDWKDGQRSGEGVFYYVNGDIYSGQWEKGLKHGLGVYTFANNKGEYRGAWNEGNFVEGQWTMTDGNIYEGKFDKKNRPCDPVGVIKFLGSQLVQQGNYNKAVWDPTNTLTGLEEYAAAKVASAQAAAPRQ